MLDLRVLRDRSVTTALPEPLVLKDLLEIMVHLELLELRVLRVLKVLRVMQVLLVLKVPLV
jgi:hypothetical protein